MIVLQASKVGRSARGHLSRWLIEITPGTFVGKTSALVRDELWEYLVATHPDGQFLLVYPVNTEQGFDFRLYGLADASVIDHDGVKLLFRKDAHWRTLVDRLKHVERAVDT